MPHAHAGAAPEELIRTFKLGVAISKPSIKVINFSEYNKWQYNGANFSVERNLTAGGGQFQGISSTCFSLPVVEGRWKDWLPLDLEGELRRLPHKLLQSRVLPTTLLDALELIVLIIFDAAR